MKAPDKVYVNIGPRQSLVARGGQTLKSDIEYIRKDALLEWAESELESITGNFGLAEGGRIVLGMLINKLNTM